MGKPAITFRTSKRIDPSGARELFRRGGFNDWFRRDDVAWYLGHALFVASAWAGKQCVGIAVATGDGRISIHVDLLLVDKAFQGQGIGSKLMKLIMVRVQRLKPFHFSVNVFERRTERFYARFGFARNEGTWLLEHAPTAERLRRKAAAGRQRGKGEKL